MISKVPVVAVASNEIDLNSDLFKAARKKVSLWIVPSQREMQRFRELGVSVAYQPFYVPESVFKKRDQSKVELCESLRIDSAKIQGKFLIGSFQRDTLGEDLSSPKWQKNPDLMLEILKKIPNTRNKFLLVLAGPRRHYVIRKCEEFGLPYLFVGRPPQPGEDDIRRNILSQEDCAKLYSLIDCYLVSSKSEGGPKAVIEAALSRTPLLTTDVGLSRDFCSDASIYNDSDEAVETLRELLISDNPRNWSVVEENYQRAISLGSEGAFLARYREIYRGIGVLN
jgi:glycosyltransferase involved in cell wall biosynthesis